MTLNLTATPDAIEALIEMVESDHDEDQLRDRRERSDREYRGSHNVADYEVTR